MPASVTITGCLEVSTDGDTFRLNDVEGADAPKSRSWRTGFFKKRPAPVVLAEPVDRQALTANVGHRVAATGQLASRELKVSSLRVVGLPATSRTRLAVRDVPHESQRARHLSELVHDRTHGAHDSALGAIGPANTELDLFALARNSPRKTLLQFLTVIRVNEVEQ